MLSPDSTPANADWIKTGRWDIPAENPDELRAYLGQIGMPLAVFKSLPVYRLNQHRIAWLAAFDQERPT